jgi:FkbM family methyltransferase
MLLKVVKEIAARSFHDTTYPVRGGLARGLRRTGGLGFLARPKPLTVEEQFLARIPLTGRTVYDVGCLEGIYTMFFARAVGAAGHVVAFEPNPANAAAVRGNVAINGFENVRVYDVGLGEGVAQAELAVPYGLPGQGTARADLKSAYLRRRGTARVPIRIQALDDMVAADGLPAPDVIKIDVEGFELPVLRGAVKTLGTFAPDLFIELHGLDAADRIRNVAEILALLARLGYPPPLHVESGRRVEPSAASPTEGHLWSSPDR